MPAIDASVMMRLSVTNWSLPMPTAVSNPTVPKVCSDSRMRSEAATTANRTMLRPSIQRVLSSGLARLCSISSAPPISGIAAAVA